MCVTCDTALDGRHLMVTSDSSSLAGWASGRAGPGPLEIGGFDVED